MIGLEWLGGLTNFVELVGSLIPQKIRVSPLEIGIKLKGMTKVKVLRGGNHWYWPYRTEVYVHSIAPRTIGLEAQNVQSSEGTAYRVDGTVLISVFKGDDDVLKAYYEHDEIDSIVHAEANNTICQLICDSLDDELLDREEFTKKLRQTLAGRLRGFGIKVHRFYIETLVTGKPLLLIGGNISV